MNKMKLQTVEMTPSQTTTKVWILEAECLVPKRGTQQQLLKQQEALRQSDPQLAAELQAHPSCVKPDGPHGGDEWAIFNWQWSEEDQAPYCWRSYLPLSELPRFKEQSLGEVSRYSISGVNDDEWIEFSFHVKASYALSVLKEAEMIPADSVLMNEDEWPEFAAK